MLGEETMCRCVCRQGERQTDEELGKQLREREREREREVVAGKQPAGRGQSKVKRSDLRVKAGKRERERVRTCFVCGQVALVNGEKVKTKGS
jgi:hypothetical protein